MEIEIVRILPQDASAILDFLKTVGGESDNLTFGKEGVPFSVESEESYIKSLNENPNSIMLLAKRNGKIVGNASFERISTNRMNHRGTFGISVLKEEWGKGIGSMLLKAIIDFAKQTGANIISLEVRSDNVRAIKLYEKFGFEKLGTFKGFFKIDDEYIDFDLMNLYL